MHAEPAGEGWFLRRFRREAKLLEKLDTPYAVRLLDYGEEGLNFHPGVRPRPQAGSGVERRKGNGGGAVAGGEFWEPCPLSFPGGQRESEDERWPN